MIDRTALGIVRQRLESFDSVVILGPRQVGKTELARFLADESGLAAVYIDLEDPRNERPLGEWAAYFEANRDRLIVLDEVQHAPDVFKVLRVEIDARRRSGGATGKFLILGSASLVLLRQSSESLAGRMSSVELSPLMPSEVTRDLINQGQSATPAAAGVVSEVEQLAAPRENRNAAIQEAIDRLWLRGGFPMSYLREQEADSFQWRSDFLNTYIEQDMPQFDLGEDAQNIGRFLHMLATDQGGIFDLPRYCKVLRERAPAVEGYVNALDKLLLVRRLPAWASNEGKRLRIRPKLYVRDSGLLHCLLNLRAHTDVLSHEIVGHSWEGFALEALIVAANAGARPYYYRTANDAEIDLLLEFSRGRIWAIEIKLNKESSVSRGFYFAADDLKAERRIRIHRGEGAFTKKSNVEAMSLLDGIEEIATEADRQQ